MLTLCAQKESLVTHSGMQMVCEHIIMKILMPGTVVKFMSHEIFNIFVCNLYVNVYMDDKFFFIQNW